MALTTCPECGGEVSTDAIACPHCGYRFAAPAAGRTAERPVAEPVREQPVVVRRRSHVAGWIAALLLLIIVLVAVAWYFGVVRFT